MKKYVSVVLLLCALSVVFIIPTQTSAASSAASAAPVLLQDTVTIVKAKVVSIDSSSRQLVPGTDTSATVQMITAEPLEGADKGISVQFENDYIPLKAGDLFYLRKNINSDNGRVSYVVSDVYRLPSLYFFIGLFVLLVLIFGGKQGVRGLASLVGSLALIIFVLLPGILHGWSPILLSIGVSSLIIVLGSYITHGFNKTTSAAVAGMILTVILTGIVAHYAVASAHLTGFNTEESVYLNFNTNGALDFVGLLLGAMLIGLLGVLYDAAIGQAIAVEELHHVAPHLSRAAIFKRAIRIGREHIGALVNTLAIAYVGVSLPILLLISTAQAPISQIINQENFATEIIRTMIGSIGLVLAVPITTMLAVLILVKVGADIVEGKILAQEERVLDGTKHLHHH